MWLVIFISVMIVSIMFSIVVWIGIMKISVGIIMVLVSVLIGWKFIVV